jgi:HrpA-like RNA helicase
MEKGLPVDEPASSSSAMNLAPGSINPLNGTIYSANYHALLKKRVLLPVFDHREEFMRLLAEHQCIVLVGETGSYKSQIPYLQSCNICHYFC